MIYDNGIRKMLVLLFSKFRKEMTPHCLESLKPMAKTKSAGSSRGLYQPVGLGLIAFRLIGN